MIRLMDRPIDTPAHRLLFCAEELPAYGYIDSINMNAGYIAGYGIKGFYVVQDLDQFEQVYGEKNAHLGQYGDQDFPYAQQRTDGGAHQ